MKIEVQQSGGFAGTPKITYSVDEKSIAPREVRQLEELLENARFFDLPTKSPPSQHVDYLVYDITVQKEGRRHTVTTTDVTMDQGLRNIIQFVKLIQKRPLKK